MPHETIIKDRKKKVNKRNLKKIFSRFLSHSKNDSSLDIKLNVNILKCKSLDLEFQKILKEEFADAIKNYKKKIRKYNKSITI